MINRPTWRQRGNILISGRIVEADMTSAPFRFGVCGIVTMQAVLPGTDIVLRERTFNNLITDTGLDRIGSGSRNSMHGGAVVGTGTATPSVSDTVLGSQAGSFASSSLGGRFVGMAGSSSGTAGPEYWEQSNVTFVWLPGDFGGAVNLTEVGFCGSTFGNLSARALIVDGGGTPVAFPVDVDEELRVVYSFRRYTPGSTDWIGTVTIAGVGSRDVLMRSVAQGGGVASEFSTLSGNMSSTCYAIDLGLNNSARSAHTGDPVAITSTGTPTGSLGQSTSVSNAAYTAGNHYRDTGTTFGSATGNGNIRTVVVYAGMSRWHCRYDPVIAKTNTQSLVLNHRIAWDRYTP